MNMKRFLCNHSWVLAEINILRYFSSVYDYLMQQAIEVQNRFYSLHSTYVLPTFYLYENDELTLNHVRLRTSTFNN